MASGTFGGGMLSPSSPIAAHRTSHNRSTSIATSLATDNDWFDAASRPGSSPASRPSTRASVASAGDYTELNPRESVNKQFDKIEELFGLNRNSSPIVSQPLFSRSLGLSVSRSRIHQQIETLRHTVLNLVAEHESLHYADEPSADDLTDPGEFDDEEPMSSRSLRVQVKEAEEGRASALRYASDSAKRYHEAQASLVEANRLLADFRSRLEEAHRDAREHMQHQINAACDRAESEQTRRRAMEQRMDEAERVSRSHLASYQSQIESLQDELKGLRAQSKDLSKPFSNGLDASDEEQARQRGTNDSPALQKQAPAADAKELARSLELSERRIEAQKIEHEQALAAQTAKHDRFLGYLRDKHDENTRGYEERQARLESQLAEQAKALEDAQYQLSSTGVTLPASASKQSPRSEESIRAKWEDSERAHKRTKELHAAKLEELQRSFEDVQRGHDQKVRELEEAHSRAISRLEQHHQVQSSDQHNQHASEKEASNNELKAEHDTELSKAQARTHELEVQLQATEQSYQQEIAMFKKSILQDLETARSRHDEQTKLNKHRAANELAGLREKHQSELESLLTRIDDAQRSHQKEFDSHKESSDAELATARKQHEATRLELVNLQESHQRALAEQTLAATAVQSRSEEEHTAALGRLQKTLDDLKGEHTEKLSSIRKEADERATTQEQQHQRVLSALKRELEESRNQHDLAFSGLKGELLSQQERHRLEVTHLREASQDALSEIERASSELNLQAQEENEQHTQTIAGLQKDLADSRSKIDRLLREHKLSNKAQSQQRLTEVAALNATMEVLRKDHDSSVSGLRRQHEDDLLQMKKDHEAALVEARSAERQSMLEQEESDHASKLNDLEQKHRDAMRDLESVHSIKLTERERSIRNESEHTLQEKIRELETMRAELTQKDQLVAELQSQLGSQKSNIHDYEQRMEQAEATLASLQARHDQEHASALKYMQSSLDEALQKQKAAELLLQSYQPKTSSAGHDLDSVLAERMELERSNVLLKNELGGLKTKMAELEASRNQAEMSHTSLVQQMSVLQSKFQDALQKKEYAERIRNQLLRRSSSIASNDYAIGEEPVSGRSSIDLAAVLQSASERPSSGNPDDRPEDLRDTNEQLLVALADLRLRHDRARRTISDLRGTRGRSGSITSTASSLRNYPAAQDLEAARLRVQQKRNAQVDASQGRTSLDLYDGASQRIRQQNSSRPSTSIPRNGIEKFTNTPTGKVVSNAQSSPQYSHEPTLSGDLTIGPSEFERLSSSHHMRNRLHEAGGSAVPQQGSEDNTFTLDDGKIVVESPTVNSMKSSGSGAFNLSPSLALSPENSPLVAEAQAVTLTSRQNVSDRRFSPAEVNQQPLDDSEEVVDQPITRVSAVQVPPRDIPQLPARRLKSLRRLVGSLSGSQQSSKSQKPARPAHSRQESSRSTITSASRRSTASERTEDANNGLPEQKALIDDGASHYSWRGSPRRVISSGGSTPTVGSLSRFVQPSAPANGDETVQAESETIQAESQEASGEKRTPLVVEGDLIERAADAGGPASRSSFRPEDNFPTRLEKINKARTLAERQDRGDAPGSGLGLTMLRSEFPDDNL